MCLALETRVPWLLYDGVFMIPCLATFIQYRFVTDGQTDTAIACTALAERRAVEIINLSVNYLSELYNGLLCLKLATAYTEQ